MNPEAAQVRAAGGVVWRRGGSDGRHEYAVIHRPRYDDWSLPKGKLDPGEGWEEAAVREVQEEIGLRCALGAELPPVRYRDNEGRAKAVRYWLMEAGAGDATFAPNEEVDALRWLPAPEAEAALSYARDRELLRAAQAMLEAT
jgi:8-oxo-dGTP diphosphatase